MVWRILGSSASPYPIAACSTLVHATFTSIFSVVCREIWIPNIFWKALGLRIDIHFFRMGVQVLVLFGVTSLLMWALPLWVLYAFNHKLFPGSEGLSQQSTTLWSGLLAVLSVNVVIIFYIILALREKPVAAAPHPDPAFLSKARASMTKNQAQDQDTPQSAGSAAKTDWGCSITVSASFLFVTGLLLVAQLASSHYGLFNFKSIHNFFLGPIYFGAFVRSISGWLCSRWQRPYRLFNKLRYPVISVSLRWFVHMDCLFHCEEV